MSILYYITRGDQVIELECTGDGWNGEEPQSFDSPACGGYFDDFYFEPKTHEGQPIVLTPDEEQKITELLDIQKAEQGGDGPDPDEAYDRMCDEGRA